MHSLFGHEADERRCSVRDERRPARSLIKERAGRRSHFVDHEGTGPFGVGIGDASVERAPRRQDG
jgi:hypothetical protein